MFLNPIQIEQRHKAELKQNQRNEEFKWSRRLLCLINSWHSWFTKNVIHTDAGVIWTKFEVTSFLKISQDFFQMNHLFVVFQKWPVPPDRRTDPMLGGRILSDLFVPHSSNYAVSFQFRPYRPFSWWLSLPWRHLHFPMALYHSFSSTLTELSISSPKFSNEWSDFIKKTIPFFVF